MLFLPAVEEEAEESSLKSEVRKMSFSINFVRLEISSKKSNEWEDLKMNGSIKIFKTNAYIL